VGGDLNNLDIGWSRGGAGDAQAFAGADGLVVVVELAAVAFDDETVAKIGHPNRGWLDLGHAPAPSTCPNPLTLKYA
jgi:hypothetical protein